VGYGSRREGSRKPEAAEEQARKEAFGLAAAERELEFTNEDAFWAICDYRCRNIHEASVKAKYLVTTATVKDMWDHEAKALLESFVGASAA
jgi:hypothetical protein